MKKKTVEIIPTLPQALRDFFARKETESVNLIEKVRAKVKKEIEDFRANNPGYRHDEAKLNQMFAIQKKFPYNGRTMDEVKKIVHRACEDMAARIVAKVDKYAGRIVDASDLRLGINGDVNGVIVGETGKVRVETITAGGYNVQCFHCRVLVKPINDPTPPPPKKETKDEPKQETKEEPKMTAGCNFTNRFPQLAKFEDRISDSDYHPDYVPSRFRDDPDMMKYDIFLAGGWAWYPTSNSYDCQHTESFRTIEDAKRALRNAVKMDPESEPCKSCPHFAECYGKREQKTEPAQTATPAPVETPKPVETPNPVEKAPETPSGAFLGTSPKFTVVFDPKTVAALQERARTGGMKVSDLIRQFVAAGLGVSVPMRGRGRPRKAK